MKNARLLLEIGNYMYSKSKHFIFFAPFGFAVLLITLFFCGEYSSLYLLLSGPYAFVNFLVFGWYALIIIGACAVWPYFMGLILIGIGQIAQNTSIEIQNETAATSNVKNTAPAPSANPQHNAKTAPTHTSVPHSEHWECSVCHTKNPLSRDDCSSCGAVKKYAGKAAPTIANDKWLCGSCGAENSKNYGQCKKCGQFRG